MAVTSAEEFFAVLEKSKLLIPSQLAQARRAAATNDNPTTIAKTLAHQNLITRWQAGQLLAGRSSFYLGKYRLIELLDRQGSGSVFLGQHVTMNRRVALKVVPRQVGRDPALLARFLADARAIAALDHPNIVPIYSVDNERERYYLVMEYVEGIDLQRLVEVDGPLDDDLAADYIGQSAEGLDHAHQRKMIHGNLRPSNLMVNTQGVMKILNLGLGWLTAAIEPTTASQEPPIAGPADYLAPEQIQTAADVDARADIYALGCTLYFLLVGRAPSPAGTSDPRAQQPTISAELAAICQKMMAARPEDRYQTVADASRALAAWRGSTPPHNRAPRLPIARRLEQP